MFTSSKGNINAYLGTISDAVRFDMPAQVGYYLSFPKWYSGEGIAGPAFVCNGEMIKDNEALRDEIRIEMLESFTPGCIQYIRNGQGNFASYGDISALLATKHGALGAVVEGYTRDLSIIQEIGFSLWAYGTHPVDAFGLWQIVSYEQTDDWLFADKDGVYVVKGPYVDDVIYRAEERSANEESIRQELKVQSAKSVYLSRGRW